MIDKHNMNSSFKFRIESYVKYSLTLSPIWLEHVMLEYQMWVYGLYMYCHGLIITINDVPYVNSYF